jgi:hypothetical protein
MGLCEQNLSSIPSLIHMSVKGSSDTSLLGYLAMLNDPILHSDVNFKA